MAARFSTAHLNCRAVAGSYNARTLRALSSLWKENAARRSLDTSKTRAAEDGLGKTDRNSPLRLRHVRVRVSDSQLETPDFAPRPSANWPTGPSTWKSIPVILANRSILAGPIAHPPSPMSVAIR